MDDVFNILVNPDMFKTFDILLQNFCVIYTALKFLLKNWFLQKFEFATIFVLQHRLVVAC